MTDKKLAAILHEMTVSDLNVVYMLFCDMLGISNKEFEEHCPNEFARFLKIKKKFEDECRAQMKAGTGKNGESHG